MPAKRKSSPKRKAQKRNPKRLLKRIGEIPDEVYVQKSTIKGAGDGLFASKTLSKGKIIGTYKGRYMDPRDAKSFDSAYQLKVPTPPKSFRAKKDAIIKLGTRGWLVCEDRNVKEAEDILFIIDARHEGNYTQFINTACHASDQNATYCVFYPTDDDLPSVQVRALKQIKKDQEILVYYGDEYAKVVCP